MKIINYCLGEEAQLRLATVGIYAPVLTSAAAAAPPEQRAKMVTHPDHIKDMLIQDEEQAAVYSTKYEEAWNRFQLG